MGSFKRTQSRTKVSVKSLERDYNRMHEAYDARNYLEAERLAERVHKGLPDAPDAVIALATSRLACGRPAMALPLYEAFLRRWPSHAGCADMRRALARCRAMVDEMIEREQLGADALDVIVDHETVQMHMARGQVAEARQIAERLIARCPFGPALNNLCLLMAADGELEAAMAHARRQLERRPDDLFARCTLAEALHMLGHAEEAKAVAAPLSSRLPERPDALAKAAQTFSVLGDDATVLALYGRASRGVAYLEVLHHVAAVAHARQGRHDEARRLWQEALRVSPACEVARLNLDDLEQPARERNGPWTLPSSSWLPQRVVDAVRRAGHYRKVLELHPRLPALAPYLVENGDPTAIPLLVLVAEQTEDARIVALLPRIAQGTRGTDRDRMNAASLALRLGVMKPGLVRLQLEGVCSESRITAFRVTREPTTVHPPHVDALCDRAREASRSGDHATAERLYAEALSLVPGARDVINNHAIALHGLGRTEDAEDILRELNERDSRYVPAAVSLAGLALDRARFKEARRLLTPLLEVEHYHLTEFAQLCDGWLRLCHAEGDLQAARSWITHWREMDENDPRIRGWETLLAVEEAALAKD